MIDKILIKYLDDRNSLTKEELEALAEAVLKDPGLAKKLSGFLVFDDALSRAVNDSRKDFVSNMNKLVGSIPEEVAVPEVQRKAPEPKAQQKKTIPYPFILKFALPTAALIAVLAYALYYYSQTYFCKGSPKEGPAIDLTAAAESLKPGATTVLDTCEVTVFDGGSAIIEKKAGRSEAVKLAAGKLEVYTTGPEDTSVIVDTPLGKVTSKDAYVAVEIKSAPGGGTLSMLISVLMGTVNVHNDLGEVNVGAGKTIVVNAQSAPKIGEATVRVQTRPDRSALQPASLAQTAITLKNKARSQSVYYNRQIQDLKVSRSTVLYKGTGSVLSEETVYTKGSRYRIESRVNMGAGETLETVIINDGKTVWAKHPRFGIIKTGAAKNIDNELENNWWDYVTAESELTGLQEVDRSECYCVEIGGKDDGSMRFTKVWVDTNDLTLVRAEAINFMGMSKKVTLKCKKYTFIMGDTALPRITEISYDGRVMIVVNLISVKVNSYLSDSLFALTKEEQAATSTSPLTGDMLKDPKVREQIEKMLGK